MFVFVPKHNLQFMQDPLDDIFKKDTSSIEEQERKRLQKNFTWIVSIGVLFIIISLMQHFEYNYSVVATGVAVISLSIIILSLFLSFLLAFFEYKDFDYYTRFYHLFLLLMTYIHGLTIPISLSSWLI